MSRERSGCPINLSMEVLGDRWSLLILRDVMFGNRRHFRDLYQSSAESIATNILASRLKQLVGAGLLTSQPDPGHKQRTIYSLTEAAIDLVPVMVTLGDWGRRWLPASPQLAARAEALSAGGVDLWNRFMDELRVEHLGVSPPSPASGPSVREVLNDAYLAAGGAQTE